MKRLLPFVLALLLVSPAWATTYYVDNSGTGCGGGGCSDGNACTATGTACLTIAGATAKVGYTDGAGASDIVSILAGTYDECFTKSNMPDGTGDSTRFTLQGNTGTATDVVIQPTSCSPSYAVYIAETNSTTRDYITVKDLTIDASNLSGDAVSLIDFNSAEPWYFPSYWTFDNIIAIGNAGSGSGGIVATATGVQILNSTIHDFTSATSGGAHGIYLGEQAAGAVIRGNTIYGNAGSGVQLYSSFGTPPTNAVIEDNIIYGNSKACMYIYGSGHMIRNNICYENGAGGGNHGIRLAASTSKLLNNTVADHTLTEAAIYIAGSSNTVINNLVNSSVDAEGSVIKDAGAGTTLTTNFCPTCTGCASACSQTATPDFTDAANDDYTIGASSNALNNGTDESAEGFNDDFEGTIRPQGAAWDIGADERAAGGATCGNDTTETGEVCDGTDVNSETCASQGYVSGTLACLSDCSNYDYSACVPASGTTISEDKPRGKGWGWLKRLLGIGKKHSSEYAAVGP